LSDLDSPSLLSALRLPVSGADFWRCLLLADLA
jgi:hypothetical protein